MGAERVGPDLDEAVQGAIGDKVFGVEDLHGGGTRVVAVVEPALDAGAIVGDAGAEAHRGFHDFERNWAPEETRHRDVQVVPHHLLCVCEFGWRERMEKGGREIERDKSEKEWRRQRGAVRLKKTKQRKEKKRVKRVKGTLTSPFYFFL